MSSLNCVRINTEHFCATYSLTTIPSLSIYVLGTVEAEGMDGAIGTDRAMGTNGATTLTIKTMATTAAVGSVVGSMVAKATGVGTAHRTPRDQPFLMVLVRSRTLHRLLLALMEITPGEAVEETTTEMTMTEETTITVVEEIPEMVTGAVTIMVEILGMATGAVTAVQRTAMEVEAPAIRARAPLLITARAPVVGLTVLAAIPEGPTPAVWEVSTPNIRN